MTTSSKSALLICLALASCNSREVNANAEEVEAEYRLISPADAQRMMSEADSYILLDVRTREEYRERRIEGAVLIPVSELAERSGAELPDKTSTILVYCQSGRRSESAARLLLSLGYTTVYDMGGITNWPYPTVSD